MTACCHVVPLTQHEGQPKGNEVHAPWRATETCEEGTRWYQHSVMATSSSNRDPRHSCNFHIALTEFHQVLECRKCLRRCLNNEFQLEGCQHRSSQSGSCRTSTFEAIVVFRAKVGWFHKAPGEAMHSTTGQNWNKHLSYITSPSTINHPIKSSQFKHIQTILHKLSNLLSSCVLSINRVKPVKN